ncbi:MAG: glycosyltransferase family 39 protein [Chlorobi bacterium]|nr:glycosyltransferase family 39 protein [Chlorobiota bacterium]
MASFIVGIIAFGTNIVFYVLVEPSMGHVYSFFLITAFLYCSKKALDEKKLSAYVLAMFFLGFTIISRPTNGIVVLLLPFLSNDPKQFSESIKRLIQNKQALFLGLLVLMAILFVAPLLWYVQTGHWIVYSYGKEGLHLLHPHFFDILFNYDKGWFIYTPLAFVAMFGFIGLSKKSRFKFLLLLTFLFIHIYITSSWWAWNYASKFSQRVFIDIYAIIGILLFYLLGSVEKRRPIKIALNSLIIVLIAFNLFQFYQHKSWVFPYGKITKGIYWDSFFRLTPRSKVYLPKDKIIGQEGISNDFETDKGWNNEESIVELEGNSVSFLGDSNMYSVEFREKFADKFNGPNRILKVGADIMGYNEKSSATLVVEFQTGTFTYSYNSYYLKPFVKKDRWIPIEYAIYVPENLTLDDFVKIIFFNPKKNEKLWVDNFKVAFITMEPGISIIEGVAFPTVNANKKWDITNGFETDKAWANAQTLTNEKAFSGKFSSFINNGAPFSITFEKKLGQDILSGKKLLVVKSMVFPETQVKETRMVMEVFSDEKRLDYFSFYLDKEMKPGRWAEIVFSAQLPKYDNENVYVKIYFWNPSKLEKIYIDDMKIELFTFNMQN